MKLSGIWQLKKMAMRNLARHKTKTILTSLAIMVSVAVYIFLNSWLGGMQIESRRNIVNFEIGAAKLQTLLYFDRKDEMPSYESFMNWEIYREALLREGYVSAPRFTFAGTLFSLSGSAPIMFFGIEPDIDHEVLRYASYVDFGRFVQNGNFEIVLGTVAAERLRVGIPTRPLRQELDELIKSITQDPLVEDFIWSLYNEAPSARGGGDIFSPAERIIAGNERMILNRDKSPEMKEKLDRYWDLIAASGRNNMRINAVIDIKAVPEMIRADRWDGELMPELRYEDIALVKAAYQHNESFDRYFLIEEDEQQLRQVLDAMIRAGYRGAVRHVNQLLDVTVVGIINSPAPLPNGNTAFIPLDILQDEKGMMLGGAVTELIIRERGVPDTRLPGVSESSEVIAAALERGLASMGIAMPGFLGVFTWQDYMADYLGYEALQVGAPQILAFLLLILSFLGISNTILLAILERTKEIGMMRAMGMTDRQMILTYMMEAGSLGLIGSILGIIAGCLINYPMVEHGIDFSAMGDLLDGGIGFRTTAIFRSMWNIPVIIGSGVVATLLASFMAYFPTKRAVKKPITDSLRFE
ncbi:MAG: FtsX-like permease family protein [Treponema sp.]|jgi:ABC-type lipoprotein release transport system permease subunit|nr:FtsX-like permease family protein [Treponema sp.]